MSKILSLDYYIFFVLIFSLPFGKSFFLPVLFIWLCLVLISYFLKNDYSLDRFRSLLILPIIIFFLLAIGINVSSSFEVNFSDLQLKMPLFILPIIYPYKRESYKNSKSKFLWIFVIGCLLATVYNYSYAIYRSISYINSIWVFNPIPHYGWNNYFLGLEFCTLIHPSYLALFLIFALLIICVEFSRWWSKRLIIKILIILVFLLLLSNLILIQSRAGILGFGLFILVWLIYLVILKHKYVIGLSILIALIGLTFLVFSKLNRYSNTFKSLQTSTEEGVIDQKKEDGTLVRFWIWRSALSAIKEHPIWGVGPSNVRDILAKEYMMRDMRTAASEKLNAHNQFFETWLGLGIIGLLALLAILFIPLWIGIKRRDWFLIGFICLCSFSFIFESMLERTAGIVFFIVFYTILVGSLSDSDSEIKQLEIAH